MSTPTRYSFRNTPTRNCGEGAYEKYFMNARKIGNHDLRKSLFNQTIAASDDMVSVKSVVTKKILREKQPDLDFELDKDSDDDMSVDTDIFVKTTKNKRVSMLKKENLTPSSNKKKSGSIVRRNTFSTTTGHTPTMQKRNFSKIDNSSLSIYEKARIKLHVANTPDCLPCRDKQFSDIFNFVETNLKNQTGGCMYVCGVPGTGKTLTVRQVVLCLKESIADKLVPAFKYIEVNAFQVTEPHQIYKLIYKELTDENVSAEHAVMLLEKKFESKTLEPIILLVDELDMLCTKKQDVLYNIFDWPYKRNSKWIVVAIANAMNLPEQVMSKISSRLGLSRMIFQPYTHSELEEIVELRLEELDLFEPDAITYAARKVAAVSGDARRALEICRRATELAERENNERKQTSQKSTANGKQLSRPVVAALNNNTTLVNIGHVDAAIKQMFSSAKITALTHCSKLEQIFMKAIAILYKKSGIEETSLNKIFEQHQFLCKTLNIQTLNRSQLLNICCTLASSKLILLEPTKNIYLQRVRCNMSIDDIDYVVNDV